MPRPSLSSVPGLKLASTTSELRDQAPEHVDALRGAQVDADAAAAAMADREVHG